MSTTFLPGSTSTEKALATLDEHGYAVIEDIGGQSAAAEFLSLIGDFIPQYNGQITHEVTYRPGNEERSHSQSVNTILAHTEAPGWQPSPAYLALFCHRQARCGGGHTDLLDINELLPRLSEEEIEILTNKEMDFPGPASANGGAGTVRTPMLDRNGDRPVLRFSFNLLTSGEYDPPLDVQVDDEKLPLGAAGRALAHRVSDLFLELRTQVLIPEGALLIWDNQRMLHARSRYEDQARHLTRYWVSDRRRARKEAA